MNIIKENDYKRYLKNLIDDTYLEANESLVEFMYNNQLYTGLTYMLNCTTSYDTGTFIGNLYSYVNGRKHGLCREWNNRGNLVSEDLFNKGRTDGYSRQWSEDGKLLSEKIVFKGMTIYSKKRRNSGREAFAEEKYISTLEAYINNYKKYYKSEGIETPYSSQIELRFQDTYYMCEIYKLIDAYIQMNKTSVEELLNQIIKFSQKWFDKKDSLYKQFKKSIPISSDLSQVNDAILCNIGFNEEEEYFTFYSYSEYQNGKKNGLELKWNIDYNKQLHILRKIQKFESNTETMGEDFKVR